MNNVVVDASAFGPFLIPDEAGELIPGLETSLMVDDILVPQYWSLEIANLLQMSVRRKRLPVANVPGLIAMMGGFGIAVDWHTSDHAWTSTLRYADRHRLTVYDAAYLELSVRTARRLITHDKALARAARAAKVTVIAP